VNVNGGELKTYEVRVAESALTRFGLSIEDIYNAVALAALGVFSSALRRPSCQFFAFCRDGTNVVRCYRSAVSVRKRRDDIDIAGF
jgi:hypothetical protein